MTRSNSSTVELERLLQRLADKVPGYPYQLALCARLSGQMEKRMADAANAVLKPLQLTYVLYQAMMIICGAQEGSIAPGGDRPSHRREAQ